MGDFFFIKILKHRKVDWVVLLIETTSDIGRSAESEFYVSHRHHLINLIGKLVAWERHLFT